MCRRGWRDLDPLTSSPSYYRTCLDWTRNLYLIPLDPTRETQWRETTSSLCCTDPLLSCPQPDTTASWGSPSTSLQLPEGFCVSRLHILRRQEASCFQHRETQLALPLDVKFALLYPAVLRVTMPHRFEDPSAATDFVSKNCKWTFSSGSSVEKWEPTSAVLLTIMRLGLSVLCVVKWTFVFSWYVTFHGG